MSQNQAQHYPEPSGAVEGEGAKSSQGAAGVVHSSWIGSSSGRYTVDRLRRFPQLGSRVAEFPHLPLRQVIIEPYRIFYFVDEEADTVWIVGAWHGAQLPRAPQLPPPSKR